MGFPVSSHRLRDCVVCWSPSSSERCTLLPFFDAGGKVERVMVVGVDTSEIRFFSPREAHVRIGLWGPIALAGSSPGLRVLEYEDIETLTGLWHYDPWWLLTSRDARARTLKTTNAVNRFKLKAGPVQRLMYARDLTRVEWLVHKKGESTAWKRFRPALLPDVAIVTAPPPRRMSRRRRWQLAPFWMPDAEDD